MYTFIIYELYILQNQNLFLFIFERFSSLSNGMNTDGNDFDTDIKDGNAVDENIDDAKITLTR